MKLKVKPNSPRTEILEETKDYIKLAVKAKPEKGEANSEVVRFLSKHFGKEVRIIRGLKSRNKEILVKSKGL